MRRKILINQDIMKYKIITDRFEIEKLAENIFICNDKPIAHIDYADLRTLRQISTFKYAISLRLCCLEDNFVNEMLDAVKILPISMEKLKTYVMHIRINEAIQSSRYKKIGCFIQQMQELKAVESPGKYLEGLYAITGNSAITSGEWHVSLIFGVDKTEEDKIEDERCEQMIEDYH